ncbi:MAG TPA: outer membrane beta-barrel protein [Kofleriaceae bacterium]|nr:outer membrane beta-barrel protein [Kofleriaceae bacterium]
MPHPRHSLAALVGGALGLSALLQGGTAEAGHAHFSGSVHVSAGAHVGVRVGGSRFAGGGWHGPSVGYARPAFRGRGWVGGRAWVGGWYPRPYYYGYYPYYPEAVPSYYGTTYYPVQPGVAPGVVAVAAAPAQPAMPTFGIGVFAGGTSVSGNQESSDLGALARIRLTPGLLIEGEVAKTSFKDNVRVDRRMGGSLIWEIGARNTFAPYLLAGGGVQQADVDDSFSTRQEYGEVGVGLRWALSRNLHLTFDVRAGSRQAIDSTQPVEISNTARSVAPPSGVNGSDDTENYTRARLAAVLNF